MYEVCPHIKVSADGTTKTAKAIARLPDRYMEHLLHCLPPDPLPEPGGYILGSMRIALQKLLNERRQRRRHRIRVARNTLLRWLPLIVLATIILLVPRRLK
jgi:hypothetical protein